MNESTMKWEVRRRLEEIERRLLWTGSLGRSDLIKRFGISPQQASADLKAYLQISPDAMAFNTSSRRYEAALDFNPTLISPSIEDYAGWSEAIELPIENVPAPLRLAHVVSLKDLTRAIHQRKSIEIGYRSLAHPLIEQRRITPHSMVFDNQRHHVRSWCHRNNDFRDFVLGRITDTGDFGDPGPGRDEDDQWNTLTIVRIGPHRGLSQNQRLVIETDYGMKNGEAQLRVRQALLLYLLRQLRLDESSENYQPEHQQIVLLNPEIRNLIE